MNFCIKYVINSTDSFVSKPWLPKSVETDEKFTRRLFKRRETKIWSAKYDNTFLIQTFSKMSEQRKGYRSDVELSLKVGKL